MKIVKLTDLCRPKQWKTISSKSLLESGYPVYGANGKIGYWSDYNHEDETLTIACRGTCGTVNIAEPKSYINGNAMCLDNLSGDVRLKYLYYYLKWYDMSKITTGTSIPQITIDGLKKIVVPLPDLSKQDVLIEKLDLVMNQIETRQAELSKMDNLIKARFVEIFGDVVANDKGWPTEPISKAAPASSPKIKNNEMVWLLNLDMVESQSGKVIDKLIVSENKINASTCAFDENNVLYSKLRPYLNKVVLPDQEGYCTTELVPLKPNKGLTREFLATLLRSDAFMGYINEKTAGAKMPRVSMNIFRQFECILPPIALQQQFSEFYKQVDKSKFAIQKSLEKTQQLFDSLMQDYFG